MLLAAVLACPAARHAIEGSGGIEGVRDNQLIGYGLVVGLAGKGRHAA